MLVTIRLGWGHGKLSHLGWVAFMLAGAVLPGLLFYRLIERPLLNLVKKRPVRAAIPAAAVKPNPVRKAA